MIWLWILGLAFGIYLLVKSADWLLDSAISIAAKLRISPLVVGLTIVAFGTSLPELTVNLISTVLGRGSIAIGNIIGSNLANILLILGVGAILTKIEVREETVRKEIPYAFLAALVLFSIVGFNLIDGIPPEITRADGLMLLAFLAIFLSFAYKKLPEGTVVEKVEASNLKIAFMFVVSTLLLFLSGELVIKSTVEIATQIGVSTYLISALIIAFGTSLPELVTTIRAGMRKQADILLGNLIGSNIFNIFGVLGISALIKPIIYPPYIITDLFLLLIASYFVFLLGFFRKRIEKPSGIALLLMYAIYVAIVLIRR